VWWRKSVRPSSVLPWLLIPSSKTPQNQQKEKGETKKEKGEENQQ
jgi:hypothetical protein